MIPGLGSGRSFGAAALSPSHPVIGWLLDSDPSIRWQVLQDLCDAPADVVSPERARVATQGWGRRLLAAQDPDGSWGGGLYHPKWISTTYTLLELCDLGLHPGHEQARVGCRRLLDGACYDGSGGLTFARTAQPAETCVTGMVLKLATYFGVDDDRLDSMIGYLLDEQLDDGGWNCRSRRGDRHSSFNTTILVLEALTARGGYDEVMAQAREMLLRHRLYRSHRTGEVARSEFTRLSFPPRWHYDVLRALEHFRSVSTGRRDERMTDAIGLVERRRRPDGRWPPAHTWPAQTHFRLEEPRQPSRWNTLRSLRVLRWWYGDD